MLDKAQHYAAITLDPNAMIMNGRLVLCSQEGFEAAIDSACRRTTQEMDSLIEVATTPLTPASSQQQRRMSGMGAAAVVHTPGSTAVPGEEYIERMFWREAVYRPRLPPCRRLPYRLTIATRHLRNVSFLSESALNGYHFSITTFILAKHLSTILMFTNDCVSVCSFCLQMYVMTTMVAWRHVSFKRSAPYAPL
jgi:hypothetical protein